MHFFQLHWFYPQNCQRATAGTDSMKPDQSPTWQQHDSKQRKTALQLINQLNTEASSRFGANLNKKISQVLLFWVSEELHFFTPPCCTQTGSPALAPVRFYRLILAIQNIHTSSNRRKSPAPPDRERDTAWFPQHNYQLPAGSRHTATDTVHLGRSLTH